MGRPFTKLTPDGIQEIRRRLALFQANRPKVIAYEFGITTDYVYQIGRRQRCQPNYQKNPSQSPRLNSTNEMSTFSKPATAMAGQGRSEA